MTRPPRTPRTPPISPDSGPSYYAGPDPRLTDPNPTPDAAEMAELKAFWTRQMGIEAASGDIAVWFCPICSVLTLLSEAARGHCANQPRWASCPLGADDRPGRGDGSDE